MCSIACAADTSVLIHVRGHLGAGELVHTHVGILHAARSANASTGTRVTRPLLRMRVWTGYLVGKELGLMETKAGFEQLLVAPSARLTATPPSHASVRVFAGANARLSYS